MKRPLVIVAILTMLAASYCWGQKSTIDPNARTPGALPPATSADQQVAYDPSKDPDKRMAEKVSYSAKHIRLSEAVAQVAKSTGVIVSCGKNQLDWRSRDVPVTVCAKKLPLGVLLRALARATHCILSAQRSDSTYTYRICYETKLAEQLANWWPARESYSKTIAAYDWEAAIQLPDVPDGEFKVLDKDAAVSAEKLNFAKRICELFRALGSQYRDRAVSGERISLQPGTAPPALRQPINAVLQAADRVVLAWDRPNVGNPEAPNARSNAISGDELEKCTVTISAPGPGDADETSSICVLAFLPGASAVTQLISPGEVLKPESAEKRFGSAPRLNTPVEDDPKWNVDYRNSIDEASDLKAQVDLSDQSKSTESDIAAVYAAMADRAGYSIVIEDWWYLRDENAGHSYDDIRFGGQRTWSDRFARTDWKSVQPDKALKDWGYYKCYLDAREKLILGIDNAWSLRHLGLIPASLYDSAARKLSSDGVYADDLAPFLALNAVQWQESVKNSKDLGEITQHADWPANPLWRFYSELSAADMSAARSPQGLPLAQYDPQAIGNAINEACKASQAERAAIPELSNATHLALHLKQIPRNILSMISSYAGPHSEYSYLGRSLIGDKKVYRPVPGLTCFDCYQLAVTTMEKPDSNLLVTPWIRDLPFYSGKRAIELAKEATTAPK